MQIRNSAALVTGANRGIGRALVDALLERGAGRVYAAARDLSTLTDVARRDGRVQPIRLDVRNPAEAREAAAIATDVSLLVNNAAVLALGGPADVSLDQVRDTMETNYVGMLNVITAFLPALERHRGAVVNMLTLVALASMPGLSAYNASKAAGLSLTQSFRRATLDGVEAGVEDIFPDPMSRQLYSAWRQDHKAVEKQFAAM